jgi:hypothetical protein
MTTIEDAIDSMENALDVQFTAFSATQMLHFEWLQSICFQLRMYGDDREHNHSFNEKFPFVFEEIPIPVEYEMSDDEVVCSPLFQDEEMYQNNPFEIHGKVIPLWARQENVQKQLNNQKFVNGDVLFHSVSKTFVPETVFD